MKRTWAIGLGSIAILLLAGFYFSKGGLTPAGQPALVDVNLQSVPELQAEFNRASDKVRMILLLSPTCPTCIQGADAVEVVLKKYSANSLVVFAIWEPMLPTDWGKPVSWVLGRLGDSRVRQYWDPDHRVAAAIQKTLERNSRSIDCCWRNGFLWDEAAVYAPGTQWRDSPPEPILLNGPVVDLAGELEAAFAKTASTSASR